MEDTKEKTKEERFKREAPDSELRTLHELGQPPRSDYSDMVFGNAADSDDENLMASVFSSVSEEAFCMIGVAGKFSMGPGEPSSMADPLEEPHSGRWKESIAEELNGPWEKGILREGPLPRGTVQVKTCFVLKIKRAADGGVERYKSRVVAKGYTRRSGGGFFVLFTPVVSFDTMPTVLAMSALKG